MENLNTYTLEELSIGKGRYGIPAPAIPFNSSKYTYLRITDINDDGSLNKENLMSVDAKNIDNFVLRKNDIVFARTGNSTGRSYFYDGSDGKLVYAGFLVKFSIDEKKVNPRILKYYTHSKRYFDWIHSFDTGGTRGNINAKTYGKMPITLPPRWIQNKIVNILKSLDDKIELNNKINRNLEAQAQAIFKSWFIDFEPFKNSKFIDSELGKIPEGWKVESIYSISEVIYGAPFSSNLFNNKQLGTPIIRIRDLPNEASNTYTTESHPKGYLIKQGDIVVGMDGEFKAYLWGGDNAWLNQRICVFKSKLNVSTAFVMFSIVPLLNEVESSELATTVIHLGKNDIDRFKIILPKLNILKEFNRISIPIFDAIIKNKRESQRLAQLRDTLLPKLMSGEVNISDFIG